MKEQKTSIWERLKIAYKALTQDYYVFFGIDKNAIIWNEDGTYKEIDKRKISSFSYIPYNMKFKSANKETNLHDFIWRVIEKLAMQAQEGKF
jgi:hypothetical protein